MVRSDSVRSGTKMNFITLGNLLRKVIKNVTVPRLVITRSGILGRRGQLDSSEVGRRGRKTSTAPLMRRAK